MPQRGYHCIVDFEDVSFDACIGCAATKGRCQFTASILRGMADQAKAREVEHAADPTGAAGALPKLNVTSLVGCLRQAYLKTTEDYYQRPDQQYWAYRGTIGHTMAERGAGEHVVAEQRFDRALRLPNGLTVTITGRPDEIDPSRSLLIDYKTTDRPPRTPSPLHIAQLNLYRWLVAPVYQIDRLGIVYLTMRGVQKAAVPVWPDGQAERFSIEAAGALADAFIVGTWPAMTTDTWMCRSCPVAATCERGPLPSLPALDLLPDDLPDVSSEGGARHGTAAADTTAEATLPPGASVARASAAGASAAGVSVELTIRRPGGVSGGRQETPEPTLPGTMSR
ncbi:MAG: PD-(D/E)XK nuclease family protein [Chloroflexi bacterium]|nr:PD-(D/E)XK nuclease family protein [Chloroflexota bacterium]